MIHQYGIRVKIIDNDKIIFRLFLVFESIKKNAFE